MWLKILKLWLKFRFIFLPLSILYGFFVVLRNWLYDVGVLRVRSLPRVVISVGNITSGGVGKTPLVEWILSHVISFGLRVAVLSRGYGREGGGFKLVSDGERIFSSSRESGDEPYQLARRFSSVIAVDKNRYRAGMKLLENFEIDLFLLDDGFQRRDLRRDLNIVVISADDIYDFLLPAGLKREPIWSLRRADVVCLSNPDSSVEISEVARVLSRYMRNDSLFCVFYHKILEIRNFFIKFIIRTPVEDKRAVAFSGIGRHDRFIRLLKENGFDIVSEFEFPDHYDYKEKDIRKIVEIFERTSADLIITTEKDYVRLLDSEFLGNYSSLPFFYTVVRIEFISGEEKLKQIINRVIGHA